MSMWEEIARIIGGGPMDLLPEQRSGMRPDYGLRGSSIQGSDLMDQLRNADRKEAMMPLGPKRFFTPEQSSALNASFGVPRQLQTVGKAAESAGASPADIDRFLRHASKPELESIFGQFKAAKLLRKRNEIIKREFGR